MENANCESVMPDIILDFVIFGLLAGTIVLMFAQGLETPLRYLAFFKEHPGLLLRSLLAVIILAPVAALLVILLFSPSPAVADGLAILAACPAAPADGLQHTRGRRRSGIRRQPSPGAGVAFTHYDAGDPGPPIQCVEFSGKR